MKKLLAILLSAITVLPLCSCARQGTAEQPSAASEGSATPAAVISEATVSQVSSASSTDDTEPRFNDTTDYSGTLAARFADVGRLSDRTKKNAVDIINGDSFFIDVNGTLALPGGIAMEFGAAAARDGSRLYLRTNALGKESLVIRNDSGVYGVDTETNEAVALSGELSPFYGNEVISNAMSLLGSIFGQDELSFVKGGSEEYEGSVLSLEEYKAGDTTIKLYYDGGSLKYACAENGGAVSEIKINALSAEPDPALFVLPADTAEE